MKIRYCANFGPASNWRNTFSDFKSGGGYNVYYNVTGSFTFLSGVTHVYREHCLQKGSKLVPV